MFLFMFVIMPLGPQTNKASPHVGYALLHPSFSFLIELDNSYNKTSLMRNNVVCESGFIPVIQFLFYKCQSNHPLQLL